MFLEFIVTGSIEYKSQQISLKSCLCVGIPGLGEHIVEDMYHLVWKGNTNN